MTIASTLIDTITRNNGKYLTMTTVWSAYGKIGTKGSNVRAEMIRFFKSNSKIKTIWIKRGARGRSDHSESQVLLFDVTGMSKTEIYNADIEYTGVLFDRSEIL